MSDLSKFELTHMKSQHRLLAWVLLILVTLIFLLFPVKLINEYRPIQAPCIFNNMPVFTILFYVWIFFILWLGFSNGKNENPRWEHLALVSVMGLCIIGFWVFITPHGSYADSIYNMGLVRYLNEFGRIPTGNTVLAYFDFPGMHLLVSGISQLTGMNIFNIQTLFLIFNATFFSALLYILFTYWLKNSKNAFLAVMLLLITSNVLIKEIRIFTPGVFGITLLIIFLIIKCKTELLTKNQNAYFLLVGIFLAMTISYFATTFLLCLILLAAYFVQIAGKQKAASITFLLVSLFIVIFMSWEIYWTRFTFNNIVNFFPQVINNFSEGDFLNSISTLSSTNIGAALPTWANIVRLFAWSLLAIASLLGISKMFSLNKLVNKEQLQTGGLLGVLALTVAGLLGTASGNQFYRYFLFAPLFAIPILIGFLYNKAIWGRGMLATTIVITVLLSLPAFLLAVNTVSTDAIHSNECASGLFLENHSQQQGTNLIIYRINGVSASFADYFVPNVIFVDITRAIYYSGDQKLYWENLNKLLASFQNSEVSPFRQKILIVNTKSKIFSQQFLGISTTAPEWQMVSDSLNYSNMIYVNTYAKMYVPTN